jgi:hypothetical protein
MCFVITQPGLQASGALSAAADDVSAVTAAQLAKHAQIYQGASAQAVAVRELFTAPLAIVASSCAAASGW